ncbi:hypothetical protein MMS_A0285 [Mycoplasma mycoides subsp. mycoides SC str. Gladysdale]|nr:hypothetical protein MMS_A0285 [Mycoplasma mycoides subsp. mycoides SC str. Gladysdale]
MPFLFVFSNTNQIIISKIKPIPDIDKNIIAKLINLVK